MPDHLDSCFPVVCLLKVLVTNDVSPLSGHVMLVVAIPSRHPGDLLTWSRP
jgi:hypothetical protein